MRFWTGFTVCLAVFGVVTWGGMGRAETVRVRVSVENLAPSGSIGFAPLRLGFSSGAFDAFNVGEVATSPIISIAEGGSGDAWFPAFAAAEPNATTGTVVPNPPGPLVPGATGFAEFDVDPAINPYFTFASMVIPSNDYFIGNDSPTRYRLFDGTGGLMLQSILQEARDIWDAGSESFDPANAAFVVGGVNSQRTPQNGLVSFDFAELARFDGLTTGAGYPFQSQLAADTDVYRISFQVVPEPGTWWALIIGLATALATRRATSC